MHYVYILEVRDRGKPDNIFYTGETCDIQRRYAQHLRKVKSKYLKRFHPNSAKKLVYVEVIGSEPEGKAREQEIKALTHIQKRILIHSSLNRLLRCEPNFGKPSILLR